MARHCRGEQTGEGEGGGVADVLEAPGGVYRPSSSVRLADESLDRDECYGLVLAGPAANRSALH
ncbi:hypothetical protein [Streptomyces griseosporeus]|uniref:hypothetical protein n=1 Tax=Streptomyces griseosporeus TaxID=1910 RepID=UPI0036F6BDBF